MYRLTAGMFRLVVAAILAAGPGAASAAAPGDEVFKPALQSLNKGDLDAAIAGFNAAMRLAPNEARYRGLRGVAWLRKGEYAKGTADVKAAVAIHPNDAGIGYRTTSGAKLPEKSLSRGQQQVAAMLRDRPAMGQFAAEADFLRQWAAHKFAGEDFGLPIDWDPSAPLHSDAEHLSPGDGDNAAILVAAAYDSGPNKGSPRSFEELWAGAVYELHNVNFAREFVRLNDEAERGTIQKTEFVAGILKYELRAAQQTRAFYVQVFLPFAERVKLPTDPTLWFCDWWDTPDKVLQSFPNKAAYPWQPYGRTHDWATVQRQWRVGRVRRALRLLQQMKSEKGYEEDEAETMLWIGRCLDRLQQSQEAITAFGEAIRLDPKDAEAYRERAKVYQRLGESEKAKADSAKTKELDRKEHK